MKTVLHVRNHTRKYKHSKFQQQILKKNVKIAVRELTAGREVNLRVCCGYFAVRMKRSESEKEKREREEEEEEEEEKIRRVLSRG